MNAFHSATLALCHTFLSSAKLPQPASQQNLREIPDLKNATCYLFLKGFRHQCGQSTRTHPISTQETALLSIPTSPHPQATSRLSGAELLSSLALFPSQGAVHTRGTR